VERPQSESEGYGIVLEVAVIYQDEGRLTQCDEEEMRSSTPQDDACRRRQFLLLLLLLLLPPSLHLLRRRRQPRDQDPDGGEVNEHVRY
jgi:hypothetical protein